MPEVIDPSEEFDRPEHGPVDPKAAAEVRDLTPSFKVIDKRKYFELIGYQPYGRQWLYHKSPARFKIAVAGRRAGKSSMAGKDVQPKLLIPNKRVWCVGPIYDLAEKEFRVVWDDMVVKLGFGRDKKVKKAYNKKQGNMFIELPWNTRIEARSAERPDTLVGEKLDHVIMSESAKHMRETWDRYIQPSLADNRGSADFPSTPEGQNWLYELWQWGQNPNYVGFDSWKYPSWENPYVYPGGRQDDEILLLERTLPRDVFLQEIAAEFTSFTGKIYDEWDEETHVKKVAYNPAWPNYVCFDFGFVNPMAAIEFQIDPMQRIHVWREQYLTRTTLEDYLEIMSKRPQPDGYKVDLCFGDAADPEAVVVINTNFGPCVADPLSKSNWREGIELVKSFLKLQQVGEIDEFGTPKEEPWLFVDHECVNTIREFNNYRANPTGRVEKNQREEAKKHDDHCFIGETFVGTSTGQKHLKDIKVGELVKTRFGYKPVTKISKISNQSVNRLTTLTGRELTGTGDHPILTDRGWLRLDAVRSGDMIYVWNPPRYGTTQTGLTGTGAHATHGVDTMEKYRLDTTSITSMETHRTTMYPTSNVYLKQNITGSTHCLKLGNNNYQISWNELVTLQQRGTEVLKDALGTKNMEGALGKIANYIPQSVNNAENLTRLHSIAMLTGSAPTSARALGGVLQALTMRREYVPGAERNTKLINIGEVNLVAESVVNNYEEHEKVEVYDITVADDHEFFANGILVSNCLDALRYGLMHIFKLGINMSLASVIDRNDLTHIASDAGFFTSTRMDF